MSEGIDDEPSRGKGTKGQASSQLKAAKSLGILQCYNEQNV